MDCPDCYSETTRVVLTQQLYQGAKTGTLRRHVCLDCGRRWFSLQAPPQLVPKYGLEHRHGRYWLRNE